MDGDKVSAMSARLDLPHDAYKANGPLRRLSRGLSARWLSYLVVAGVPTLVGAIYFGVVASDQYVSEFRFSVRQAQATKMENSSLSSSLSGGSSLLAAAMDSEIVVDYIQSHQIVDDLRSDVDLRSVYARPGADFFSRLPRDSSPEKLLRYWREMVDPYFDMTSGLVTVKVRAFTPADAQRVAQSILVLSERLVNQMSDRARADRLRYAEQDVQAKEDHLKAVEVAMTSFRNQHGILFPAIHANETTSLDAQVREQIAQASASLATLSQQGIVGSSPQVRMLRNRIAALNAQQSVLQAQLTSRQPDSASSTTALASSLGGYEELEVEERLAEHDYDRAMQTKEQAADDAAQQQVYLSAYVRPDRPSDSLYPPRIRFILELFLSTSAFWCLATLIFYGVKEHLD